MKNITIAIILAAYLVLANDHIKINPNYKPDSAKVKTSVQKSFGAIIWDQLDQQAETGHNAQAFETHVGKVEYGTGVLSYYSNKTYGLVFDVLSPTILKNVSVYPSAAGTLIIRVLDSSNAVVDSVITSVTAANIGLKTPVDLNFFLPAGTNYKIDAKGTVPNLARNTSGGVYPFTSNLINIKGVISGTSSYYYFFYDWRLFDPEVSNVGPEDKNIGGGSNYVSYSDGIVFNISKPSIIKSVNVYPSAAGNVAVRLLNSSNQVLQTKITAVSGGGIKTQIDLDFEIASGTGYKLDATGTTTGLWRNNSGAIYPYNSECMTITGAINSLATYYYFFYDLEVLDKIKNRSDYDCEIAADFLLSEQTTIRKFKVKGWLENEVSANHVYKLKFYSDNGNSPSNTVLDSTITSLNLPGFEGVVTLDLIKPVTLPAGIYWVGFQALTDIVRYDTGKVYFSHRNITANSTQAYWRNPGDGLGTGSTSFTGIGSDICFALYSEKGVSGYVSGNWTLSGSPYYIDGNIKLQDENSLVIDPGVHVIFRNNYRFFTEGELNASGSSASKIIFEPYDQNTGWGGIRIYNGFPDYIMNDNDSIKINNCTFRYANSQEDGEPEASDGGALMIYRFSKVRVSNCLFEYNSSPSRGSAIASRLCGGIIENNIFASNNSGSVVYLSYDDDDGSKTVFRNNIIRNNETVGLESYRNNAYIVGNLFYGNELGISLGGLEGQQPYLINNTIVGNNGTRAGGIYFFDNEGTPIFANNIIYGNNGYYADQIYINENECDPVFLNCDIEGGKESFGGDGGGANYSGQYLYCFDQDPLLNTNYSLTSASPCINMGYRITSGLQLGALDLFGQLRIFGYSYFSDRIDVGASEYNGAPDTYRPTTPEFTPIPGTYDTSKLVTISSVPATGVTIYYSLDGSYPNIKYSVPVQISSSKTLRARSTYPGMLPSFESQGVYNIYGELYSGNVSGTWYKALSPYYIGGDITIPSDSTLTIEPGVEVIFTGHHLFKVEGKVIASGNLTDSIRFKPVNTSEGWQGVRIEGYDNLEEEFNSVFSYCVIEKVNTNASWQGAISVEYQNPTIQNSRICNNTTDNGGAILLYRDVSAVIKNNNIYGNVVEREGGAIYMSGEAVHAEIRNNYIHHNKASGGGAIYSECNPLIVGNVIFDNYADDGGALMLNYNGKPDVFNNTIVCNRAKDGGAVNLRNYSEPNFINNIIYYNTASRNGDQIFFEEVDYQPEFIHCDLQGGVEDIYIEDGGTFNGVYRYSIDVSPSFTDTLNNNFYLNQNSHCINHGTIYADSLNLGLKDLRGYSRIYNGSIDIVDIGAFERQSNQIPFKIIMPEFSPNGGDYPYSFEVSIITPNYYATIYYTTDGSEPDQTSAVYSGPIPITQTTTLKAKAYYLSNEPSYVTTQQYNIYPNSYSGNISGIWYKADTPHYLIGDVEIPNGLSLTIQPGVQVISTGNYKFGVQGKLIAEGISSDSISFTAIDPNIGWQGIHFDQTSVSNDSSSVSFCNIEFATSKGVARDGGAFFIKDFSKLTISNSSIRNNRVVDYGTGAGIYLYNSSPVISENLFEHNTSYTMGSGITCAYNSNPLIIKNKITENIESAIFCDGSSPKIVNNLITYNEGSGIRVYSGSNPEIINNTISFNEEGIDIDGLYDGCNPSVKNTVVYNNTDYQVYISGINCQPEFNYCNIQGGLEGFEGPGAVLPDYKYTNNIDSDPKFLNAGSNKQSYKENSPCINAGSPDISGMNIPSTDLSGKVRLFDGYVDIVDIGAYEYNGLGRVQYSGVLSDSIRWVADIVEIAGNVSMPDVDSLKIVPGVHIDFKDEYVVQLHDSLIARGTEANKIVIENAKGGFNLSNSSKAVSPSAEIKHWIYNGDETDQEAIVINGYDNIYIDSCSFTNVCIQIRGGISKAGSTGKKITNNSLSLSTAVKGIQKAAILVDGDFDVAITGNQIANADTGIVVTGNGIKAASSKKITNNSLSLSTAVKSKGATLGILLNNTGVDSVYHNSVYNADTGIKAINQISSVLVLNNIFWNDNNLKVQINDPGIKLILKNNDISGTTNYNTGGNSGNINSNPLFVNASRGDLHLNSGSLCINAGLNIPGLIYYGNADIGAFEYGLDWSTPYNLAATGDLGVINLTWSSPYSKKGLSGYKVYRDGRFKASTVSPGYNDTSISNNVEYRYHVTAVYSSPAGESGASNSVIFTATTSILAPTELTCSNSADGIQLNWLNGITSKGLIKYYIYRDSQLIDSTVTTQYNDNNVMNMFTYEYYVTAVYEYPDAESSPSESQFVTVMNPPDNISAEVNESNVYLSWKPPVSDTLTEGFEAAVFPPSGWSLINRDGDSNNWFKHSVAAHTGAYGAISKSYSSITPDNYLITPLIYVNEGAELSYYAKDYYIAGDHYSVLVSTSGNDQENFVYNLYEETIPTSGTWYLRNIDLSQFEGKCVFIAFRHYNCTNKGYLTIDDISVNSSKDVSIKETELKARKITDANDNNKILLVPDENPTSTAQKSSLYITGYEIYRNYRLVGTINDPAKLYFYDTGLTNAEYSFTVKTKYSNSETSDHSSEIIVPVVSGANLLLYESFENAIESGNESWYLPDGWTAYDQDGDNKTWSVGNIDAKVDLPDGTYFAYSITGDQNSNVSNWLVSPQISLSSSVTGIFLKFFVSYETEIPTEKYYVKVSTTGCETDDFTDIVYEQVTSKEFGVFHEVNVDLSAYTGQDIYLAWHHLQNGSYGIILDMISVTEYNAVGLQAPSNVNLTQANGIITITWDRILKDQYLSYNVYSSTDLINWELIQSGITDTFWSENITGTKKFYRITSSDTQSVKRVIKKAEIRPDN